MYGYKVVICSVVVALRRYAFLAWGAGGAFLFGSSGFSPAAGPPGTLGTVPLDTSFVCRCFLFCAVLSTEKLDALWSAFWIVQLLIPSASPFDCSPVVE